MTSVSFRVPPPLPVMSASFHFFLLCCQRALYPTLRVTQDVCLSSFVKSPVQYIDVDLLPQRALCTVSHGSLFFYRDMCDASRTSCSIVEPCTISDVGLFLIRAFCTTSHGSPSIMLQPYSALRIPNVCIILRLNIIFPKPRLVSYLILMAFITGNSSLEPLLEGLLAQIHIDLN